MTNKETVRPQFRNFPRLKEAENQQQSRPSIYNNPGSDFKNYKNYYHNFESPQTKGAKRKRPNRFHLWVVRNPVKFQVIAVTVGLSLYYSKFIYDIFLRKSPELEKPQKLN